MRDILTITIFTWAMACWCLAKGFHALSAIIAVFAVIMTLMTYLIFKDLP